MIKLDYKKLLSDYMVFGIHYCPGFTPATSSRIGKTDFCYCNWWTIRLWPCLQNDKVLPRWYMFIFDYFEYGKEGYEEGVE